MYKVELLRIQGFGWTGKYLKMQDERIVLV